VPIFRGAHNVLDVGCGRGEFLALLRDDGVEARGIDINAAMVDVCRRQGFDVTEADAVSYLEAQPDASLGGLFAAQVVEHLEPRYLNAMLDVAFDKLRPGAPIVLETINPACWFAFFESYIRDITHVRPLHPDTLKFLLIASGFQQVDIRYRSPYPEHEKLQPISPNGSLGDAVETLNANVERINRLLFTWLDYAALGRRA
jgi:O-antigen chain-terminating methyltransferase